MEMCIDSLESARKAIESGAMRLELSSALSAGGLTPTPGMLRTIKSFSCVPIYVMLRPRAGNFVYSKEEMDVMLEDLKILKDYGADGFEFGALTSNNELDVESCKIILSAAEPLPVTFNRAFDEVNDPPESLEVLVNLGFERVLILGPNDCGTKLLARLDLLKRLLEMVQERTIVIPGSGTAKDNILWVKKKYEAKE